MNKIPLILDTDPGIDDALAIAVGTNLPQVDMKLITTVAGNIPIEKTTQNTLDLLALYQKDIPVAKGASKPLIKSLVLADNIHGNNGLGNVTLDKSNQSICPKDAIDTMAQVLEESTEKVTITTIGPLTNLALFIQTYPNLLNKIDRVIVMGGGLSMGNITSTSEFNFFVDPEAVNILFQSNLDITIIGLNATSKAILTNKELLPLKTGSKAQQALYQMFAFYQDGDFEKGLAMHDVSVFAYLDNPDMFTIKEMKLTISLDELTRGALFHSNKVKYEGSLIKIATDLDTQAFIQWILPYLEKL